MFQRVGKLIAWGFLGASSLYGVFEDPQERAPSSSRSPSPGTRALNDIASDRSTPLAAANRGGSRTSGCAEGDLKDLASVQFYEKALLGVRTRYGFPPYQWMQFFESAARQYDRFLTPLEADDTSEMMCIQAQEGATRCREEAKQYWRAAVTRANQNATFRLIAADAIEMFIRNHPELLQDLKPALERYQEGIALLQKAEDYLENLKDLESFAAQQSLQVQESLEVWTLFQELQSAQGSVKAQVTHYSAKVEALRQQAPQSPPSDPPTSRNLNAALQALDTLTRSPPREPEGAAPAGSLASTR